MFQTLIRFDLRKDKFAIRLPVEQVVDVLYLLCKSPRALPPPSQSNRDSDKKDGITASGGDSAATYASEEG